MAEILVEPFDAARHRRVGFDCGKPALDGFLNTLVSAGTTKSLGVFAVEVFAIDGQAAGFYAKFGFIPLLDDPRHMYLPTRTIEGARA